jgi:uncharacterized protein (DUF1778 family)
MSSGGQLEAANVVRQELRLFMSTADMTGIDRDRQRRFLRLSQDDWQQLLGILCDNPVPPHPALPLLLRHLGYLTSRLDRATREAHA